MSTTVRWIGWATLAFLFLPLLAVAVMSVNATRFGVSWGGFSGQWYVQVFTGPESPRILAATGNTLLLATLSTFIATALGTGLAFALRAPWRGWQRAGLDSALLLPVVTPDIILAAALVALRQALGVLPLGFTAMVVGHVTLQVSFVALIVRSRLIAIGDQQEEAARDLYASDAFVLRRVVLPQLRPAIIAGAMLAFTLSLDDVVISFFTAGPADATLPLYIQSALKRGMPPEIHALSTLVFLATVVLVLLATRFTRKEAR